MMRLYEFTMYGVHKSYELNIQVIFICQHKFMERYSQISVCSFYVTEIYNSLSLATIFPSVFQYISISFWNIDFSI